MPAHSPARSHVVAIVLLMLASGCAKSPTSPAAPAVQLTVNFTPKGPQPGQDAIIHADVVSNGMKEIWHCQGCGCGDGIKLEVLGPDGTPVELNDPKAPRPDCADGLVRLDPGGRLELTVAFTGTLYVQDSPTYPSATYAASPGTYTVVTTFGYSTRHEGETQELRRVASFLWKP